jgi:tetratricopeptide (TPR) repeat protein
MFFPGRWKLVSWRMNHSSDRRRAEAIAARYLEKRPNDPKAWGLLGNLLVRQGRHAEAERILEEGLDRHSDPDLGWLLARAQIALGKRGEARQTIEDDLRQHPDSYLPYLCLIRLAVQDQDWDQALAWGDDAFRKLSPDDFGGKYELAGELAFVEGGRERAIALLKEAAPGLPRFPLCHVLLGVLLEDKAPTLANKHLAQAQRHWRSKTRFEDFLEHTRTTFGAGRDVG